MVVDDRPAPAADDDPQDRHVPRAERDAGPDPRQDQVRLEPAHKAQARDEGREDRPGQDPRDEPEDADDQEVLEAQALERVEHLPVVDEPRQDHAEHDRQHAGHDADPDDRVAATRRLGLGDGVCVAAVPGGSPATPVSASSLGPLTWIHLRLHRGPMPLS